MIHATVAGNIGRDPELRSAGDTPVLGFSVASNTRKKVDGRYQDVTDWVDVSVWGKRGEALAGILGTGSYVVVRGALTVRKFRRKDGTEGQALDLRADDVELGPKRERSAGQHHEHSAGQFGPAPAGDAVGGSYDDDLGF